MKFPRNAKIFRGQLDATPFAGVFFLLVIFMLLASLVYTPGVAIQLPVASDMPGVEGPTVAVAMDASGRLYFENQPVQESELRVKLQEAARKSGEPLTLLVKADKAVDYAALIRLTTVAREAGIKDAWLETLPTVFAPKNAE